MLRVLALACLVLASTVGRAANDRLLFWEASLAGSTTWLLGSMHLARPSLYPLREEITAAFRQADALAVELDIAGPGRLALQEKMLARGMLPEGKTLPDVLSPGTWRQLETRLSAAGLPAMLVSSMQPGLVVTTLTMLEMTALGLDPALGVDAHFLGLARGSKTIIELETVDEQLSLLLDTPNPDLLVSQTLYQLDSLETLLEEMLRHWKSGDAEALRQLVLEDELERHPEFAPLHERMFDHRNRAMAEKILRLHGADGTLFVVVGAGHLLGDEGIVSLLRRRGFTVTQR